MKSLSFAIISLVLLSACSSSVAQFPLKSETIPVVTPTETLAPTPTQEAISSPTAELAHTPRSTPSPPLRPPSLPGPVVHEQPGSIYETFIQIPVGEDGIQYRGAGVEDMEPVGPNGLVVTADGVFVIGDVFGNRLLRFDADGNRLEDINLTPLGILNISDLVGAGNTLYILEISFKVLPERYRVNQLSAEGELVRQYDLPNGFHFEDGLYGLAIGYPVEGEAQVLVQLSAGAESVYFRVPDSPESLPEELQALSVYGSELSQISAGPGEIAVLGVGEQDFESRMTAGGTIFLLSARPDGSLYLSREDLLAWEPAISTDITIHYISPDGMPMGVARYPLKDWYFHLWRFLTVGPDGNVYGLITRERSVDVLRLNFYQHLDPLLSEAVAPAIMSVPPRLLPETAYDCNQVERLAPGSPEVLHILEEVLENFHRDLPTEYMGFEQVWSVDRLGEYAIIQGMVTPEESAILVVQLSERGFILVGRYAPSRPLPDLKNADVADYFRADLPGASPELFYCLDLSRFVGGSE